MINFTCDSCKKKLQLENRIYDKAYKDHDLCLDCRPHGGKREGAGRPTLGTTKKISLTLPDDAWNQVDQERGSTPRATFIREALLQQIKYSPPLC